MPAGPEALGIGPWEKHMSDRYNIKASGEDGEIETVTCDPAELGATVQALADKHAGAADEFSITFTQD